MMQFLTSTTLAAEATEAAAKAEVAFQPFNFIENLRYMGIGMLVIFVIIGVIILATMLTNYLFSDKKD